MNPSNPSNGNAPIYKFKDSDNVERQAVPLDHTHSISEVESLQSIIAELQAAVNNAITWKTIKQVYLGQGGADAYGQYGILVKGDFFVYQQIRLVPVGGDDTICEYGAVKTKGNGPYYITSDIDVYSIASTHATSTFNLQVLQ